jgi:CRP-like cAMP-binding protein
VPVGVERASGNGHRDEGDDLETNTFRPEQRLGQTLLQLARTMGKKDPRSIRIELKISHEELSEMVGTTRPRISVFMQRFRNLGLIETNRDHFLIIKEKKLTDYLAQIA